MKAPLRPHHAPRAGFHPRFPVGVLAAAALFLGASFVPAHSQIAASEPTTTDQVIVLNPFIVTSDKDSGYRATNTVLAMGFDQEVLRTPYAINVVTSTFLEDLAIDNFSDLAQYVPNFSSEPDLNGLGNAFRARGFRTGYTQRNRFRHYVTTGMENVERVEVVKGPLTVFYGRAEPGGIMNYVTKKASFQRSGRLSVMYGSFDELRVTAESEGPLIADKLAYRVAASRLNGGSEAYEGFVERDFMTANLTYRPLKTLSLFFEWERQTNANQGGQNMLWRLNPQYFADYAAPRPEQIAWAKAAGRAGADADDGQAAAFLQRRWRQNNSLWAQDTGNAFGQEIYPARFVGVAPEATQWGRTYRPHGLRSESSHKLDVRSVEANWTATRWLAVRSAVVWDDVDRTIFGGFDDELDGDQVLRPSVNKTRRQNKTITYQAELLTQFNLWKTRHKLMLGYNKLKDDYILSRTSISPATDPLDYRPGSAGLVTRGFNPATDPMFTLRDDFVTGSLPILIFKNQETGMYASHMMELLDGRINTLVGARTEEYNNSFRGVAFKATETIPTFGATFEVKPSFILFANRSQSFSPNAGGAVDGNGTTPDEWAIPTPPRLGTGTDVGFKFNIINNTLYGTVSLFRMEYENERRVRDEERTNADPRNDTTSPTYDPNQRVTWFKFVGLSQSEGAELDLLWTPNRAYSLKLSYGWLPKADVVDNPSANLVNNDYRDGTRYPGNPEHHITVWNQYSPSGGPLKGYRFGLGCNYFSAHALGAGPSNIARIPGALIVNAMVGYRTRLNDATPVDLKLNLDNLTGRDYLRAGSRSYGRPFTARLSATFRF